MHKLLIFFLILTSLTIHGKESLNECKECKGEATPKEKLMLVSKSTKTLKVIVNKDANSDTAMQVDATPDFGGENGQFTPGDLLASSLSSCMMINMKSAMLKRDLNHKFSSEHKLSIKKNDKNLEFEIDLLFTTDAPKKYEKLLTQMINACPYKKALGENVKLNISLNFKEKI